MKIKKVILSLLLICFGYSSLAQEKTYKWSPIELHVQNRLFHKGMGYQTFNTQIDLGFGVSKKLSLHNNFNLEFGLTANYGRFTSKAEPLLFISSFKRTNIHHFSHSSVSQFSLEIPIGFEIKLFEVNKNPFYFTSSAIPQIGLNTLHFGTNWEGNTLTFRESIQSSNEPFFQSKLISDFYLRSGLSFSFASNKFKIGSGLEYSTFGESYGLYTKLYYSF